MATYIYSVTTGQASAVTDLSLIGAGLAVSGDISDRTGVTNLTYANAAYDASGRVFVVGSMRSSAAFTNGTTQGMMVMGSVSSNSPLLGNTRLHPLQLDTSGNLKITATAALAMFATASLGVSGALMTSFVSGQVTAVTTASIGVSGALSATLASGTQYIGQASAFQTGTWIVTAQSSAITASAVCYQSTSPWVVSASNIISISGNVSAHAVTAAQSGTWDIRNVATVSAATASQNGVVWGVTASAVTASQNGVVWGVSASAVTASQNGVVWGVSASAVTASIASGTVTLASGSIAAITSNAGTPVGLSVDQTARVIKASNTARKAILITNNGNQVVYIGHTNGVTTAGGTMGLMLAPSGVYADSGWGLYTGDVYGICSATASANVAVSERS